MLVSLPNIPTSANHLFPNHCREQILQILGETGKATLKVKRNTAFKVN